MTKKRKVQEIAAASAETEQLETAEETDLPETSPEVESEAAEPSIEPVEMTDEVEPGETEHEETEAQPEDTVEVEPEAAIQDLTDGEAPEIEPQRAEDVAEESAVVESLGDQPLKVTSLGQAKAIVEAMLFVAGDPVSVKRLAKAMGDMNPNDVRGVLAQLMEEYDRDKRGLQIVEVAGGFQLASRPEYADWILQLTGQKRRSPLTGAALETLAIIAYKQPITRAEVDAIRGVESGGVVRTLLDLELIEVKGRKEVLGKPQLYGTSDKFLRAFGLNRLEDLPSIQELRERYQIGKRQ